MTRELQTLNLTKAAQTFRFTYEPGEESRVLPNNPSKVQIWRKQA